METIIAELQKRLDAIEQALAELKAKQQFPLTNFNITNEGMVISIMLAPNIALNQMVPEETMNAIAGKWLENRREVKNQIELIKHVKASKVN